ncbi:sensor histidine kinase [Jatrophihabitans endophyticus]|uniref:sensor histidine kinase n=1 Tax=Jatrophihabitans endophyticus TaxID=1206085 RepID=UPI0009347760|nr:GAF domain-containing protein [Jatrophihabitans endophyticus]
MSVFERTVGELPATSPLPAVADAEFDTMAKLTRRVLDAPMAMVSLVNRDCQVVPGAAGVPADLDRARTNSLDYSFCQYVVRTAEPFVVEDAGTLDFLAENLSVTELGIAAYAGMPLVDARGDAFGSLCVLDHRPRHWSDTELETLDDLAAACSAQFQLREANTRAAVVADRDRIARELHSGVVTQLFELTMGLGSMRAQMQGPAQRELDRAIGSVDAAIARIRDLVYDVDL